MLWTTLVLALVLKGPSIIKALQDDMFYFTSFADTSEWAKVYSTCDPNFDFQYYRNEIKFHDQPGSKGHTSENHESKIDQNIIPPARAKSIIRVEKEIYSLDPERIPFTSSPISITHKHEGTHQINKTEQKVILIFNNPAPPIGSYSVSYGFQKNKQCLSSSTFRPCYVSPTFGKVRGVVVTAERPSLRSIWEHFTVEEPEKFVNILNGGSENERKFYEAIFMGTTDYEKGKVDCKAERSTHVIDGKCYPMEIYLYFVDEIFPAVSSATLFVILVEEGDEENLQIRPIVNTIKDHNGLYIKEVEFLRRHRKEIRRERIYHHMKTSGVIRDAPEEDSQFFIIPNSIEVEKMTTEILDHWEKFQGYRADNLFLFEEFEDIEHAEDKLKKPPDVKPWKNETPDTAAKKNNIYLQYKAASLLTTGERVDNEPINSTIFARANFVNDTAIFENSFQLMRAYFDVEDQTLPKDPNEDRIVVFNRIKEYELKRKEIENKGFELVAKYIGVVDPEKNEEFKEYKEIVLEGIKETGDYVIVQHLAKSTKYQKLSINFEDDGFPLGVEDPECPDEQIEREKKENIPALDRCKKREDFHTFLEDSYVDDQIRQFLDEDNSLEHVMRYPKLKRKEPKTGTYKFKNGTEKKVLLKNLGMSDDEYKKYEKLDHPLKIHLKNSFQISWLIPKGGGMYLYKGSSPVPPCFQTEQIVVFRKPIKMTREQIRVLTTIPTSEFKDRDITNTLGVRHSIDKIRANKNKNAGIITFDKRNHQFLRDDGFHKNSILEAQARKNDATRKILQFYLIWLSFVLRNF